MDRTPGLILPSAYSSAEELQADLQRRDQEAGFTTYDPSALAHSAGGESLDDILAHYGVKGMHWGVRKDRPSGAPRRSISDRVNNAKAAVKKDIKERTSTETTVRAKPGQMVRVVGGLKRLPHQDAIAARTAEQIAKKNTLDALSNQDLQRLVSRMNLESQYRNLASNETRVSAGEKYALDLVDKHGDKAMVVVLGSFAPAGKQVLDFAVKGATANKALAGGKIKNKDSKDNNK